MGEWDFSSTTEPNQHVERKVVKKVVHPKHNFFTYENDLALVRLGKKVPFQPNIVPICLPGNDDLLIGKSLLYTYHAFSATRFSINSSFRANRF